MKHLFIVLSILFATTYAADDMGGDTESIIENTNLQYTIQPQRVSTPSSSDYEGTYETPHNPYTGDLRPYTLKAEIPHIELISTNQYGFDRPLERCFDKENAPQNCFIPFTLSKDYKSKHPKLYKLRKNEPKTPIVYISTKINENVSLRLHLSNKTNDRYCIIRYEYDEKKDEPHVRYLDLIQDNTNQSKVTLSYENTKAKGIFKIFPSNSKVENTNLEKKCQPPEKDNSFLAIQVLPYEEDTRKFIYIQMDGGDDQGFPDYSNKFTKTDVETEVNNVFKQALIKVVAEDGNAKIEEKKENFHKKLYEVNMIKPEETEKEFDNMINHVKDFFNVTPDLDKGSEAWHILIAINKIRKKWPLKLCTDDKEIKLSKCERFNPENESQNTTYFIKSSKGCREEKGTDPWEISIRSLPSTNPDGTTNNKIKEYYAFDANKKKINLKNCDTLFTDNGYPVVPYAKSIKSNTQAISIQLSEPNYKGLKKHKDYLPYGSIIVVPRGIGTSTYISSVHELLHSFGLTDVTQQGSIMKNEKEYDNKKYSENEEENKEWNEYLNVYATTETNTMNWSMPIGNKIKYRDTPIACTGGKTFYARKKKDNDGKKCDETRNNDLKCIIPFSRIENTITDEKGENQWDCLRNCYTDDENDENYTEARMTYWNDEEECATKKDIRPFEEFPLTYLINYFGIEYLKDYFSRSELEKCKIPGTSEKCFSSEELELLD